MMKFLLNKHVVVVCDDVIEHELTDKTASNNDFLLYTVKQGKGPKEEERSALYKMEDT